MSFTLRKATRQKTKIRIGLSGPSGSGKTYSALLLASGMAPWEKIAVIDTENGSADLYSHLGPYSVITLTAPFTPERYIEAIQTCQQAGMDVIIIDSATHEWDGKGGCLESNQLLADAKFKGNTWGAWSQTTPRHQRFIEAITTSPCHIITTARAKTETIQTDDKKVKKVGMKEIQREGFEYELTLNFTLDRDGHYAVASKDRTELFSESDPFRITKETGEKILAWAQTGAEPKPAEPKPEKARPTVTLVMEQMTKAQSAKGLETVFKAALKYPWPMEDLGAINECYSNCLKRLLPAPVAQPPESAVTAAKEEPTAAEGQAELGASQNARADAELAAAERAGMAAA